jgi:7-carboxy-7-deazaguanine synthase
MRVAEKFISINGEGVRAGELAVFVRFQGCNLRCHYCDTRWALAKDCPCEEMSPEQIHAYTKRTGIKNVTLTGGEPLLHKDMDRLLAILLADEDLRVEIETNGAVDLRKFCACPGRPVFTMDYKLPSSGYEKSMVLSNFELLSPDDTVKFVSGSTEDLEKAYQIIQEYDLLRKCHVYFSPVFGDIEPVEIVNFMMDHKLNEARLQIQMHKVIWHPDKRGV